MADNEKRRETFTADSFYAITGSDTVDLARPVRAVLIGVSGNLVCHNAAGESVTIAVVAGQLVPIQPKRVLATGTTATGLIGLV